MMESIPWGVSFLYFLFSIAIPSIIYLLFFSNGPSNLPPGSYGWPLVGETIHFGLSGPDKFISDRMKKHSTQIFKTSMLGEKTVVFCGAEGNKFVFNNENNLLSPWLPPCLTKIIRLKLEHLSGSNFNHKFSVFQIITNKLNAILKTESLKHFISVFNDIAQAHVKDEWEDCNEVKVLPLTQLFSFSIACRYLMGMSDENEIKRFATLFDEAKTGIFSMPINLPGTAYHRAIKAGKTLHQTVTKIIEERRKQLQENENGENLDLLAQVLQGAPDDIIQEPKFELQLRSLLVGTLLAATSSPGSTITFTLKYLTEMPHIYNRVYQEQMEIAKLKGEENYITWDDLNKMEYTWNVVREVLRVMPPLSLGGFREVKSDFTYAGYTIPKGWKVLWAAQTSHKDPAYFENPDAFNPSRFERDVPTSYSYVPFGGGRGICPGKEFSKLYMLIFIHIVVTKFRLEKLDPKEGIKYHMTPFPENGFPVRLIRC